MPRTQWPVIWTFIIILLSRMKILKRFLPVHSLQYLSCSYNNNSYYVPIALWRNRGQQRSIRFQWSQVSNKTKDPIFCWNLKYRTTMGHHFGVSGFGVSWVQALDINTQHFSKLWKYVEHFGVSGFGISWIQNSIIDKQQLPKLQKVISTSRIRSSGFHVFKCPNNNIYKTLKWKKGKVGPTLRDFRVRNFASSGVQTST
jgi:hypothetical protein